jgi:thiol-disulfide isomerase/thioredoxin
VLALVFIVAAFGKFFDLEGSRRALTEFGVSERIARFGGLALPATELCVAIALLIRPSARWGSAGAALLLCIFVAAVARAMSQGRAPDCHCFGQIHSEPAGASTLIRNVVFGAAAVFVLVGGNGPSLNGGLESLDGTQFALLGTSVLAAALAVAVSQLWVSNSHLRHDLANLTGRATPAGLPRGTTAPAFELRSVRGEARSLAELIDRARPVVLVFVSTNCGPCLQMLPALARWQQSLAETLTLAAIFSGEPAEIERLSEEHELSIVVAQEADEVFSSYALRATPSAMLIDAGGSIAAGPAEGVPAIEALMRSAMTPSAPGLIAVQAG